MKRHQIKAFDFKINQEICGKYIVKEKLGAGWEGEVYKIIEKTTGIERAAKFFYPHRNIGNKIAKHYAKLLHRLSSCPIVIHYQTYEKIIFEEHDIMVIVSEYVCGEQLSTFLARQRGKYIGIFPGLQLLHALAAGLESMHSLRITHGDLHPQNIIIKRYGLGFDLKVLDMYRHHGSTLRNDVATDIYDSIRVFYDAIGGAKKYSKHPPEIKGIILGLKRGLIQKKFKTASQLKNYLENTQWTSAYRE
jgi:serine/threonine protein kinase